ncbi:Non-canonical poly(A) RNA polymerase PAPD5 [Colletotrichum sidae]|uniref:polynucleotide adenylyltransferase n=1 Tax=Colletotrichum sidae TaxID=1347389 RepID=A0A4V6QFQ1_9PEZI|nr:Non-canonical poly(A) RNA polymerase PAPD5 [Colletotrichum sidae]
MSSYRPSYSSRRGNHRDDRNRGYDRGPRSQFPPPPGAPDSYRNPWPEDREYRRRRSPSPPRRFDHYESYRGDDTGRRSGAYDGYRPNDARPPQGDFTFRMDKPAGVGNFSSDSYRPGNNDRRRGGRGRGGFRGRGGYQKIIPAERELLRSRADGTDENLVNDADAGVVYRDLDELSDDEEAAMDISDNSDDDSAEPSKKRVRRDDHDESGNSVPKWSNPDPYTALPPPDADAQRKKRDMVKLIRKARVDDAGADKLAASTEAEEFISFDMDGGDDDVKDQEEIILPPANSPTPPPPPPSGPPPPLVQSAVPPSDAPSGPRADFTHKQNTTQPAPNRLANPNGSAGSSAPSTPSVIRPTGLPPKPAAVANDPLGSRKRTVDDLIKPPTYGPLKKINKMPVAGDILPEWLVTKNEDPTPWIEIDHSQSSDVAVWLHKEIVDFYELVKPRDFEHTMRTRLVDKLSRALRTNRFYKDCEVRPFGSYMSGLYLPTADMDLVICARRWLEGGYTEFLGMKALRQFGKFLSQSKITNYNSMEFIAGAKVPLVKYIDNYTGLRVDISFDRLDGPKAVKTFLEWSKQYPAMPILVTMIKHFLAMRGLNEPVNGGIGSFTVTCMVVSMLQLMPQVQSRNLVPEHHLGEMLMEFFDLYGNRFDYVHTAIRLTPPGYISKARNSDVVYKNLNRLSVIDPNNPANDISGGSSNAGRILDEFRIAHHMLQQKMTELSQLGSRAKRPKSILETIYAGNYSSFRHQRAHLRKLYDGK